ncbi:LytR C-terminal domain-containing protein [Mycolicibacterium sp. 050158]|uniref:LytR C-terminal domain-containing protein n=1 Tax=Mycolicibacterium sp. 050158 TaxID=3090602 RepID=UPI00299E3B15|nr:LytR C-terminal domain-containing protein [Mycolicibacterium sp. 050158]MDX1892396.1 LytR C-terminal domain-containing protein [Mycolicibacterium sp. 050158]
MNQRDSSGLPLRAMVMVLLFLGVVFLLVGFQAMGSGDDAGSSSTSTTATTTSAPAATTSAPAAAKPAVRVYNLSDVAGLAEQTATRLRDAQWNVAETGNLALEGVTATTVYYGQAAGEKEAAEEIGNLLQAPVEPRTPAVADQPPGVIVAVTS